MPQLVGDLVKGLEKSSRIIAVWPLLSKPLARSSTISRRLVGWSLTSLFSTNMAISETKR